MLHLCALDEAAPSFVTLVREMDGRVPEPTLCVDSRGRVHAAALPARVDRKGCELEGLRLEMLLGNDASRYATLRKELATRGRARVRLSILTDSNSAAIECDCVQIDGTRQETPVASRSEQLTAELMRSVETVAHDLKSPLTSALGFASLLESQCTSVLDETAQTYLANLRKNVESVRTLVEGLVEYTRARDGAPRRKALHLFPILEQIAAELKPDLDERGVKLQIPPDLETIYADPQRFRQVALNLIVNSIHHMGPVQEGEIQIEVRRERLGRSLVVRDNGMGLPEESRLRILELFRSGGNLHGSGLGLSIVRRVMEAHGGYIEVESSPLPPGEAGSRSGACFIAFFPDPL